MGCFDITPDTPAPRSYAGETRDTLQAQIDLAPQRLAAEASSLPGYNALQMRGIQDILLGAGPQSVRAELTPTEYAALHRQKLGKDVGVDYNSLSPEAKGMWMRNVVAAVGGPQYKTTNIPASRGLLDIYSNEVAPTLLKVERQADPSRTALKDMVMSQAQEELGLGARLDPTQRREAAQSARAAWSSRGMGYSRPAAVDEVIATTEMGNQMKRERQNYALSALGLPSNNAATVSGFGSQAAGLSGAAGPRLFNPESAYGSDVFNTNYNAQAASNIASANNRAGVLGGALSY